ncbi:MAG: cobalt-zinc-cadmium resistance protein [Rhizobacter sp.]|nr:cobalt-zinc-cadmium resistance protein [Rhizobacter sp.]
MRRLFILLLALLLPLQFTWAAAAVYCGHEGAVVVADVTLPAHHFGHHEHVHHAEATKDAAKPLSIDTDCSVCHAGSSPVIGASLRLEAPLPAALKLAATSAAALASAFARAPDRPQWPVLA